MFAVSSKTENTISQSVTGYWGGEIQRARMPPSIWQGSSAINRRLAGRKSTDARKCLRGLAASPDDFLPVKGTTSWPGRWNTTLYPDVNGQRYLLARQPPKCRKWGRRPLTTEITSAKEIRLPAELLPSSRSPCNPAAASVTKGRSRPSNATPML